MDRAWEREALRLHDRYSREIVEAFALCPWAKRARLEGKARARVLLQEDALELRPSLGEIAELAEDAGAEVAFLIYPRLAIERQAFEDFAARVRTADAERRELGTAPFVFAAFHPDAEADTSEPERLIPFLRRTPDPTLQLLRPRVVEHVRAAAPQGTAFVDPASLDTLELSSPDVPLREQIARANLDAVRRAGVDEVRRRLDDIRRDRDRAYQRLQDAT
jgi:hypothetical protein